MTMMLLFALALLLASIVVVGVLVAWHPTHDYSPPHPPSWAPQPSTLNPSQPIERAVSPPPTVERTSVHDWCEHVIERTEDEDGNRVITTCPNTPTHELVDQINQHGGGASTMVATYCADHAPEGAVRVRTLAPR